MTNEARHIFLSSVLFVETTLRLYTSIDQLCTSLVHAAKYKPSGSLCTKNMRRDAFLENGSCVNRQNMAGGE